MVRVVTDDPDRPDRATLVVKGNQQRFDEPRLGEERRKAAVGQVHQLDGIAVDADAARAFVARHRAAARGREYAGDRFPAKDLAIEQADAGGVRGAEIDGDFDQLLQEVARVVRHFGGKRRVGAILARKVGRSARPRVEEGSDVDLVEGRRGACRCLASAGRGGGSSAHHARSPKRQIGAELFPRPGKVLSLAELRCALLHTRC